MCTRHLHFGPEIKFLRFWGLKRQRQPCFSGYLGRPSGFLAFCCLAIWLFWEFSGYFPKKQKKNDYIFSLIHCFCMILHHFILLSKRLLCVTDISCITSSFNIRVGGAVVQSSPGTREVPGSGPHPGNNFFTLFFQILLDSSVIMGYSVQARNFESPERAASVFAFLYVCPFVY